MRLFATLLMLTTLALSQGVHSAIGDIALIDSHANLARVYGGSGGPTHEQEHRNAPIQGCHHSSCSQSFLVKVSLSPARSNCRSCARPVTSEQNPRTVILDRDPPVPRFWA